MSYGVPGGSPARHIVYNAPEAGDGTSAVTATAASDPCLISITAGSGGGFAGHPLMFQVGAASDGCTVAQDTNVASGTPPPGDGVTEKTSGGCSCDVSASGRPAPRLLLLAGIALLGLAFIASRRRSSR